MFNFSRTMPVHLLSKIFIVLVLLNLQACGVLDGWINGEDNTPPPTELQPLAKVEYQPVSDWQVDTGDGRDQAFVKLYPVIQDSLIAVIDRNGQVSVHDRSSGKTLWQKDFDMIITGGLGASEKALFFSNDQAQLFSVNIENGDINWRKTLSSISLSRVVVVDDVVVSRTLDGKLYGLQRDNGEQLWIYDRGVPVLSYRGNSSPVADEDGVIYVGFDSGKVVALEATRGALIWESTAAIPRGRSDIERMVDIDGDPLIVDGTVYAITANGRVVAMDTTSGELLWAREMSSHVGLAADRNNIYVTDADNNIWAMSQSGGNLLWKQDKLKYRFLTQPAVLGEAVLVLDFEGYLHIMSVVDGQLLGRRQFDDSGYIIEPLVYQQSDIYLYSNDGKLTALRLNP